jgi:hypothetical protein
MAQIGKLLVFFNLALSVVLASFALGVYSQRLEWGLTATVRGESVKGEAGKRQALYTQLKDGRSRAEARWQRASQSLPIAERNRRLYELWYAQQLKVVETGLDAAGKPVAAPVKALVYDKGRLKRREDWLDRVGYAALQDLRDSFGQPLKSLESYVGRYERNNKIRPGEIDLVQQRIGEEMAKVKQLLAEEAKLTVRISQEAGEKDKPGKGLRALLAEARAEEQPAREEQESLTQVLRIYGLEEETIRQRQAALEARLQELQAVGLARGRP